jgi:hypothetical protein
MVGLESVNAPAEQRNFLLLCHALNCKHLERRLCLQVAVLAFACWVYLAWWNEEEVGVEKEHHFAALEP